MTTVPTLDELPDYPNPDSVEFEDKIGPFTAALPVMVTQYNASIAAYNLTVTFPDGQVYQAQSNISDATSGRLMMVGAFGWGLSDTTMPETENLDMHTVNGFIRYGSTTTGRPSSAGVVLQALRLSGGGVGTVTQVAFAHTGEVYVRTKAATGWNSWVRMLQGSDILGTVSQSSGAPTGSIVERGGNANGEYVRFADGTQICTALLTTSTDVSTVWTFPASFTVAPATSYSARSSAPRISNDDTGGVSASSAIFNTYTTAGSRAAVITAAMAVGRWF